jgi:hypothetical protein
MAIELSDLARADLRFGSNYQTNPFSGARETDAQRRENGQTPTKSPYSIKATALTWA